MSIVFRRRTSPTGRPATGVRGITWKKTMRGGALGGGCAATLLGRGENGIGKRTSFAEYRNNPAAAKASLP